MFQAYIHLGWPQKGTEGTKENLFCAVCAFLGQFIISDLSY
jgi:hypothetical protein